MEKRLPISVCMVASAEAHRIRGALESVAGWTSELIVVLNQEVQDGTDRIAESFGAKVFREPWKGFIGQKNSAIGKASQPWLLNLDSDEVISPGLRAEITATVLQPAAAREAYSFPRCTFYCGRWIRHGDWYPDRVVRLWQRGTAQFGGEEPHDRLITQGRVGRFRADLLHFSNQRIAGQIAKIAPYQEPFIRRRLAAGKSSWWGELAFRPAWRFFRAYCLRLGFLDGWQGFYIARLSAFSTLTRYAMLREAAGKGPETS